MLDFAAATRGLDRLDFFEEVKLRLEVFSQIHHGEFGGVPQLIAEESVALNSQDIEVDVPSV